MLTLEDSVKADPDLASTILYGLVLPKDMDQLPGELAPSFKEMCSHLVLVPLLFSLSFVSFSL